MTAENNRLLFLKTQIRKRPNTSLNPLITDTPTGHIPPPTTLRQTHPTPVVKRTRARTKLTHNTTFSPPVVVVVVVVMMMMMMMMMMMVVVVVVVVVMMMMVMVILSWW